MLPLKTALDDTKAFSTPIWELIDNNEIGEFLKKINDNNITNSVEEFSIATSGGVVRFVTITILPLIHTGELSGRIIKVRDITESKTQAVAIHRMENLANLTKLAAEMAHDIKNPLGAISIHVQLLQKAVEKARENNNVLPPPKFVENHIKVINQEIEQLNSHVMNFLLAARPVNATLELKEPESILENTIYFFEPEFTKEEIQIVFNKTNSGKKIMLDEKLFHEIILNIAQNALYAIKNKFSNENDKQKSENKDFRGKFIVNSFVKENRYVLQFSDNGCGMSQDIIPKIFEPYFTTKATGSGLGLPMVFKIIKEFSGDIKVESKEGVGSRISIILPIPQKDKKLLTANGE
jgi:signal transduction histidine kinase